MDKKTVTGRLSGGLVISKTRYTGFTLREADVGDMIDAEADVGPGTLIAFNTALAARQISKLTSDDGKEYTGPVVVDHLRELSPRDYAALRIAQKELETLGEPKPETAASSTAAS